MHTDLLSPAPALQLRRGQSEFHVHHRRRPPPPRARYPPLWGGACMIDRSRSLTNQPRSKRRQHHHIEVSLKPHLQATRGEGGLAEKVTAERPIHSSGGLLNHTCRKPCQSKHAPTLGAIATVTAARAENRRAHGCSHVRKVLPKGNRDVAIAARVPTRLDQRSIHSQHPPTHRQQPPTHRQHPPTHRQRAF
jgi:hypothetical protein